MVLAQPTTLCNLDDTYCYLPERAVARRMTAEVADAVAAGVGEWSREHPVAVLWHGGEPLAAGVAYLRFLMDRFGQGEDHLVTHAVQTNATLIDERWCELFATRGMRVGVSLDGAGKANAARVDRRGHVTTDRGRLLGGRPHDAGPGVRPGLQLHPGRTGRDSAGASCGARQCPADGHP
ncbi:radical SAM protein [Streptomyces sp. NPDC001315]|uniref:radical SAM protein n=1 Tax=Streptomyces sp. NPDC001315 TaxID=3364562 RepID=UPI00368ABA70